MEESIADFVDCRNVLLARYSPPTDDAGTTFELRLKELAQGLGRPSLESQIASAMSALRNLLIFQLPRTAWVGGIIVAIFTIWFVARHRQAAPVTDQAKVTATQFLDNVQASDVYAWQRIPSPIVYQKLRIRVGDQDLTRTIYRDRVRNRQTDKLAVSNIRSTAGTYSQKPNTNSKLAEDELRQTFESAGLSWSDPMSAIRYRTWSEGLHEKSQVIQTTDKFI